MKRRGGQSAYCRPWRNWEASKIPRNSFCTCCFCDLVAPFAGVMPKAKLGRPKQLSTWKRLALDEVGGRERWVELSTALRRTAEPQRLYAEPLWLTAGDGGGVGRLAVFEGPGALAVFIQGVGNLPLYVDERRLGSISFRRATLADFRVDAEPDVDATLLRALLERAREDLGTQVVFQFETHELGYMDALLEVKTSNSGAKWLWLEQGPNVRRFVRFGDSFEEYFQGLSGKTRHNVRRGRARLTKESGAEPRLVRVSRAEQVEKFVCLAQHVSRKTYQWQMLGLGLRDTAALASQMRFAAEYGWLRSYLFLVGEEPVAFIEGYQYAGTFQGTHSGYDPDFGKYSVGMLAWVAAIEDMYAENPPRWLDFGSGDALYKRLLANCSVPAIQGYLWPATLRSRVTVAGYRAWNASTAAASRSAERLGVKARLKRWFRSRAAAAASGRGAGE